MTIVKKKPCKCCEIDDKTKDELRDKIKEEAKNEIKEEIKREIDWCNRDKTSMEGIVITKKILTDKDDCFPYSINYKNNIGQPGWFTKDLLTQFFPDLMGNKKIVDYFYTGTTTDQYHAGNFVITFKCEEDIKCGSNINFSWGGPSNMWCNKEGKLGIAGALCPRDFLDGKMSVCCSTLAPYADLIYSRNFFLSDKCPNLVLDLKEEELKECAGKTIVAKLESPLFIIDHLNNIIDKNGDKTEVNYILVRAFLNSDGTVKEKFQHLPICKKYSEVMDKILWTSDEEVKLKIPDNLGKNSYYSPSIGSNQDETFPYHENYDSAFI